MDPSLLPAPLARCRELTVRSPNHLHHAAEKFEESTRYDFFLSAYACMRTLDDLVDEEFLRLPARERAERRPDVLDRVAEWEVQVVAAASGEYLARDDDFEPLVFTALNSCLGASDLGSGPFSRLARSLRRDVREERLATWQDLLDYCEGAAVAPGAVFLYLLTAQKDDRGRLRLSPEIEVMEEARDLAHFCYFTHIVRDLRKDAASSTQLLTLPDELLKQSGYSRASFSRAVLQGDEGVRPVILHMLGEAESAGARARERMEALRRKLPVGKSAILDYLFDLYRDAHESVRAIWSN
jgi:phytoene synthase